MFRIFSKNRMNNLAKSKIAKYLLYAFGEITLIVLGILIALQINNWNTERIERNNESKSYRNIKRQVVDDMMELNRIKDHNNYLSAHYEYAVPIALTDNRDKIDTLAIIVMSLSQYSDFNRSSTIYENLVSGGEIKLLKNSDITSGLQRLEMTYTYINKLEEIHWEIIINELSPELRGVINYATLTVVKPEKLYSVEIQNFLMESIFLTIGKDSIYNQAIDEINTIIELIDMELDP